ncbi:MAG: exonuclease SbcCD subunit D [Eubacteriales bacterium]
MKFIHLSDLHIGKKVNGFSMLEDQKYILKKIINVIDVEKPNGVIIAGDVYDKSIPSAEGVELFDDFLYRLSKRNLEVYVISGNHDSPERLAFGSRVMNQSGVYMSPVYNGEIEPIVTKDDFGELNIYMLPFIKPAHVRKYFIDENIENYTDAMAVVIENMKLDQSKRNLLITHQFVTGAIRSESEDASVGGLDNVEYQVFLPFDYVALGHIHRPQKMKKKTIRYCGTPLKYSFSEVEHVKSVTVVDVREKENVIVKTVPLEAKRDMREIKGKYEELTLRENYIDTNVNDYMHITLTDEDDIMDAVGKLRTIYPNLMKIDYDNMRTRSNQMVKVIDKIEEKAPLDLLKEFYEKQNNQSMNEEQIDFSKELMERIWGI